MMTQPLKRTLVALPLLYAAGTCSVYAETASEDRAVGHFSKLVVGNGIDVYLTQSTAESLRVEVKGEGFALADVLTEVEGDVLKLSVARNQNRSFPFTEDRDATVYLNFIQLSSIEASGGSDIESRNGLALDALAVDASGGSDLDLDVDAQSLDITVSGGSDVDLRGKAESLTISASGGSDISADSLTAERVNATVSGGSDADIRATAAIVLDASSGSDVSISGNPPQSTINADRSSDVSSD